MSTDSQSIFDYIFGLTVPGVKLELSRVESFMERIGNPHRSYPVIHIAGTNGKGSTAAMLASILDTYGYKTGLFTSPHLIMPNERIRVGQELVPDEFIVDRVKAWRPLIDELGITFFEVLTALGMAYFKQQAVDYAVLETGLGGRLDATNVVDPELSIITSVSMDHENILGDTLAKITGEKAGIIKPQKPVVLSKNVDTVCKIVLEKCRKERAEFLYVPDRVEILQMETHGITQQVKIKTLDQLIQVELPLLGHHQVENFTNVLVSLVQMGIRLDETKIQAGLNKMRWQGRMQALSTEPLVLYDVAHNPEGLDRLLEALEETGRGDTILIPAFNARKNIQPMLEKLEQWSGEVNYSIFAGHSAVDRETLMHLGIDPKRISNSLEQAFRVSLEKRAHPNQAICFLGSHYLAETLFTMFPTGERI